MGTQKNRLNETVLLSTKTYAINYGFKNFNNFTPKLFVYLNLCRLHNKTGTKHKTLTNKERNNKQSTTTNNNNNNRTTTLEETTAWTIFYQSILQRNPRDGFHLTFKSVLKPDMYSKTCVKRPLKKNAKNVFFKTDYRLMQVKSIAECSKGSILQYFRPSLSYHFYIKTFIFSIFKWLLKTGVTVYQNICLKEYKI